MPSGLSPMHSRALSPASRPPDQQTSRRLELASASSARSAAARGALESLSLGPNEDLGDDEPEFSEPSADLQGLLAYFEALKRDGARLAEVTYIVNDFTWWGISMKHHGFVLKAERLGACKPVCEYLTLDFSRRGILWDTFGEYPNVPDGTIFERTYKINTDPLTMKSYCEDTPPFSWVTNDCSQWAQGVLRVVRIKDPFEGGSSIRRSSGNSVRISCGPTSMGSRKLGFGCFS